MHDNGKTTPTHKISFSEKHRDERGHDKLGAPVEVATVWPRKGDKQGGIIQWNISPSKLENGVFFMVENERQQSRGQRQSRDDGFDQADTRAPDREPGRSR